MKLRTEARTQGVRRTVRTIETVECQQKTILIGSLQGGAIDSCPLCGHRLGPAEEEPIRPRLLE
jgi:hypothetical protein